MLTFEPRHLHVSDLLVLQAVLNAKGQQATGFCLVPMNRRAVALTAFRHDETFKNLSSVMKGRRAASQDSRISEENWSG